MTQITTRKSLLWLFAAAWLAPVPARPQALAGELRAGESQKRQIAGTEKHRWSVALEKGQFARLVVEQRGTDVAVTLFAPDGAAVFEGDSPASFGPEAAGVIAAQSGTYILEVRPFSAKVSGPYEVRWDVVRPARREDEDWLRAHQLFQETNRQRGLHTAAGRAEGRKAVAEARPLFARLNEPFYEGWCVLMDAAMLAEGGNIRAALDANQQAAALLQRAGADRDEAVARNNIGGMLDVLGDPVKALESYARSLLLARATRNPLQETIVLNNIGKLHSDLGNWQTALDHFHLALPLARAAGAVQREALLTHNIGMLYLRLGELAEAQSRLEQALPLWRAAKDKRGESDTLQAIGNLHGIRGNSARQKEALAQALELAEGVGDRRKQAEIRRDLGHAFGSSGNADEAVVLLRRAQQDARSIGDRRTAAHAQVYLSRVLLGKGEASQAGEEARQAVEEFRALGDRAGQARALERAARAERAQGNKAVAQRLMEDALRITEDSRTRADSDQLRASFFASQQDSYGFYISLLLDAGDKAGGLEASERSRARGLMDMLAAQDGGIHSGVDTALVERQRNLTNTLNAKGARLMALGGKAGAEKEQLEREIGALELDYQDVLAAIRKASPRYAAMTQPAPLRAAAIQGDLLDSNTVLLEYLLTEERSYLWAVTRERLEVWTLPGRREMDAAADRVYSLLTARATVARLETPADRQRRIAEADAALPEASAALAHMLLGPAAAFLEPARRQIVVVPDGSLQRIPFAMLPFGPKGDPLVEAHEVVTLPSASALSLLRKELSQRQPAPKMVAVFADPVFDAADPRSGGGETAGATRGAADAATSRILEHLAGGAQTGAAMGPRIPRLPYTRQEAEQILNVAKGAKNWEAIGFAANRQAASSPELAAYRYVHFATHGFLDTERPSLSGLVLSQINDKRQPQDGFLRVNDIYNTRLNADLVVLSACQTGLGKEVRGEGLMGLTRAFLYAGAPRVVVSLWNVNDRATAGLMSSFYRRMLREGKTPSAALREAQREMRKQKQWSAPYYWAAFVQHGEWR